MTSRDSRGLIQVPDKEWFKKQRKKYLRDWLEMVFYNSAKINALRLKNVFKNKPIQSNNSTKKFYRVLFYLSLFKVFALIVVCIFFLRVAWLNEKTKRIV